MATDSRSVHRDGRNGQCGFYVPRSFSVEISATRQPGCNLVGDGCRRQRQRSDSGLFLSCGDFTLLRPSIVSINSWSEPLGQLKGAVLGQPREW